MPLLTPPGCARYPADSSSRVCLHYAKSPATKAPSIRPLLPLSSIVFSIFMFGHSPLLLAAATFSTVASPRKRRRREIASLTIVVSFAKLSARMRRQTYIPVFLFSIYLADDWRISRSRGTAICREEDRSWIKRPDYKRPINFFILFAPRTKNRTSRYCCDRFFSPGRILFISLAAANQRFRWLSRAA